MSFKRALRVLIYPPPPRPSRRTGCVQVGSPGSSSFSLPRALADAWGMNDERVAAVLPFFWYSEAAGSVGLEALPRCQAACIMTASISFWGHFSLIFQPRPPHTRRVTCLAECRCASSADLCLQSDVLPDLGLQGVGTAPRSRRRRHCRAPRAGAAALAHAPTPRHRQRRSCRRAGGTGAAGRIPSSRWKMEMV